MFKISVPSCRRGGNGAEDEILSALHASPGAVSALDMSESKGSHYFVDSFVRSDLSDPSAALSLDYGPSTFVPARGNVALSGDYSPCSFQPRATVYQTGWTHVPAQFGVYASSVDGTYSRSWLDPLSAGPAGTLSTPVQGRHADVGPVIMGGLPRMDGENVLLKNYGGEPCVGARIRVCVDNEEHGATATDSDNKLRVDPSEFHEVYPLFCSTVNGSLALECLFIPCC